MKDKIYYLTTDSEHGKTEERLRLSAAAALGLDAADSRLEVRRTPDGKPYFPLLSIHCSVSHSGGIWLCALSDKPVGVDVQQTQSCRALKIAGRFFHLEEIEWLGKNENGFFDVWCAKESYVKFVGKGLSLGLDSFSVIENGQLKESVSGASMSKIPFLDGYTLYLCGGSGEAAELVQLQ